LETLWTIGHSTHTLAQVVDLLRTYAVTALVDVRTVPRSRTNPQFNREALTVDLPAAGIRYSHMPALGGLRKARIDSPNMGWRNTSFRGYADYMQTVEFETAMGQLLERAAERPTAVMCAEAVHWRCHRSLIADAAVARGWQVRHILNSKNAPVHSLTPFAQLQGTRILYPPG
jgi:Uncharacterized conserved protein